MLMCIRIAVAVLVIAAAWALQGPAGATSVIALAPGVLVDPNAATHGLDAGLADFNTPAAVTAPGQSSPPQGPFAVGGASFSGGAILGAPGQSAPGLYAAPAGDTTQYLTIGPFVPAPNGGASEQVNFGPEPYLRLGLFWGSMEADNAIEFYSAGSLVATVTGTDAAAAVAAAADATVDPSNRYIFISGVIFDAVVLKAGQHAFELDNLAWGLSAPDNSPGPATPLPPALPLFATGLAGLAWLARRRRKQAA